MKIRNNNLKLILMGFFVSFFGSGVQTNILADKIELFESHDMENVLKYSIKNNEYPKRKVVCIGVFKAACYILN